MLATIGAHDRRNISIIIRDRSLACKGEYANFRRCVQTQPQCGRSLTHEIFSSDVQSVEEINTIRGYLVKTFLQA